MSTENNLESLYKNSIKILSDLINNVEITSTMEEPEKEIITSTIKESEEETITTFPEELKEETTTTNTKEPESEEETIITFPEKPELEEGPVVHDKITGSSLCTAIVPTVPDRGQSSFSMPEEGTE